MFLLLITLKRQRPKYILSTFHIILDSNLSLQTEQTVAALILGFATNTCSDIWHSPRPKVLTSKFIFLAQSFQERLISQLEVAAVNFFSSSGSLLHIWSQNCLVPGCNLSMVCDTLLRNAEVQPPLSQSDKYLIEENLRPAWDM